jgi:DNA repair exonuclease SbcCD ATPase subunit
LNLKGQSIAILGPNGSGKSSIVDALDFLLTGNVRRLSGEGAQELKLAEHGRHVDAKDGEGTVLPARSNSSA